jgi:hypothetical protein
MRHITPGRLPDVALLVEEVRKVEGLTEKKPGTFYKRSSGFLHFHEHGDDIYADVKLDGTTFERRRVTTKTEQRALARDIRNSLRSR